MQTQMNRVNFDLIVNELLHSLEMGREMFTKYHGKPEQYGHYYFREFRTIGFSVPKQLGKSSYLIDWVSRDSSAVLIVRDSSVREVALHNWSNPAYWECDRQAREVTFQDRVLTLEEVKQRIKHDTLPKCDTYLVDDSLFYFHFIASQFHGYLCQKEWFDAKIVHVG
jgi:hypothetical protein